MIPALPGVHIMELLVEGNSVQHVTTHVLAFDEGGEPLVIFMGRKLRRHLFDGDEELHYNPNDTGICADCSDALDIWIQGRARLDQASELL